MYCQDSYLKTCFYKTELGNKRTISNLSVQQSNNHPLGAEDDPMNCCPSAFGLGQQFIGSSTAPRG